MAFSFGNSGSNGIGSGDGGVQTGPDLEDIRTEALAFLAIGGDNKVQLSSPWPSDNLPPPTASLMSVASHKGLVAAAGPDAVIVATTESVRQTFNDIQGGKIKQFQAQLRIPMPMRISQLAFSSDESYLVLSAENGGGLAVYETQALMSGSTQSAFELSTNGQALRALVPNPTAEKGELFAIITTDGNLMMANLKDRNFISSTNGQVLKNNASCLSWSTKGKQLVAGLGDGTAYQMTPEGEGKGDIPKPPTWTTVITFLPLLGLRTITYPPSPDGNAPASLFHVATRILKPLSFMFQKIEDPAGPWGMNRSPPHHFVVRLRDWNNLQDMVVTTSTASVDIGLFTRSKVPLSKEKSSDKITGVFTMTEMESDAQRAQLPMTSSMDNTSAIGLALDLSSKEKVVKPIVNDEIDESATPLPALMVLNNEGILASWWIVYSESIREKTMYPSLVATEGLPQPQVSSATAQTVGPAFGAPAAPSAQTFGAPTTSASAFGARPATSFGTANGAFGATSGLGQKPSVWGSSSNSTSTPATNAPAFGSSAFATATASNAQPFGAFSQPATSALAPALGSSPFSKPATSTPGPAFGAPAFGSTSTPSFGSAGLPGMNRPSPWGSAAPTTGSTFGQSSGLGKPAGVFGTSGVSSSSPAVPASGGFSSFASKGGFAAAVTTSAPSVFGTKNTFSSPNPSPAMNTASLFGGSAAKAVDKSTSLLGAGPFKLGSMFKADPVGKDSEQVLPEEPKSSFFGGNFGSALDNAPTAPVVQAPVSKETDMDAMDDGPKSSGPAKLDSTTPAATPAPVKSSMFGSAPGSSGIFGTSGPTTATSATKPAVAAGFSFGTTTTETPKPPGLNLGNPTSTPVSGLSVAAPAITNTPPSPKIKEEPSSPGAPSDRYTEPPLPPDPTSKTTYAAGDTSVSSTETEAPLPPDFIPKSVPTPNATSPSLSPPTPAPKASTSVPTAGDLIPPSDVPGGLEDDGDESGFGSEGGDDEREEEEIDDSEEGSGEDVTKDLSPTSEFNQTPGFTPQSSFKNHNKDTPDNTFFTKISKPGQASTGRGLFGEIGASAPVLPPPKMHASPRSPSPVRSALPGRMLRPDVSRSVSAPGVASQILGRQPPASAPNTFDISHEQQKVEEQRRQDIKARNEQEEKQALVDDEDDRMQEFLASDLEGTRTLDEFIAHTDYVGPPSKDSIPAQVETVYRDINAMIDTLGVNSRALKCFVKGHEEHYKDGGRNREDLQDDDDWCLVEIENLSSVVENDLGRDLEAGRVKDVANKLETCNDLQKDLIRLHAKMDEVHKLRAAQSNPNFKPKNRLQPLSAEQSAQQHDLRRDFANFQKLLSEAEEGLTILKAKIVSQATAKGHSNGSTGPTVEAVMRTITKMTSMAEKRSGDIDVLEGQMRRLRFGSAEPRSREGSPFATPQNKRSSLRNPGTSSTYGLFYTPDSTKDTSRFQNSLMSSTSSRAQSSPPRKKLSGYTAEEKAQIRSKFARKNEVTNKLKEALKRKSGPSIKLMYDDDD
ncbi:Nuclear pore [Hyphodiscus hymeniophilus]|uniref:Nuclear pore n=1 Tax=Hyphodiscus hymeniophilus TaxID=353542 RepID=A0A9P7AZG2_9HELO|nr:Nuclear pore [Hyphodiscus hymeniophilus]